MPGGYWAWLGGTALSLIGVQAMAFAMAWVAAGQGGGFAALVLTAINLPRVLLLLVGGAVADRVGPWPVMIVSVAVMVVVAVASALAVWSVTDPRLPLLLTALAIGIVDAFHLPSTGSMPRRLVPPAALARAMSARHLAGQLALFAGPAAGSLILAAAGLAVVALANAASFLVLLWVLLALLPRARPQIKPTPAGRQAECPPTGQPGVLTPAGQQVKPTLTGHLAKPTLTGHLAEPTLTGQRGGASRGVAARRAEPLWRAPLDGLRVAWSHPVLRATLLLTGVAAGFLLPVTTLLVPLLARQRTWSPQAAGVVVAAVALGTATVAVAVLIRGALPRPGAVAAAGLLVAAGGVVGLAGGGTPTWAAVAGLAVGAGSGVFATHVGPLILAATPATHLARVQSVLVLVQSLPLLLTTNVLGSFAEATRASTVLYGCAAALGTAGLVALASPILRRRSD
ncbi:MFS transporter [Micromonospora zingiberis]|uniref:MFS transporter n=1 Tax=Micromonospora zingiberis TaxID=2053011 RepID=A0A4V2LXN4_9ACTN|nr:MFS transporter [Micromonospora zingiberis]